MASNKSATALRTIGEVAEELDVATHVLRFWESKFHQIKPQKRRGRRYYRPEDVNIIVKIKELLYEQGYTIRGVQKFLIAEPKKKTENAESNNEVVSAAKPATAANPQQAALQPNIFATKPAQVGAFKTDMFGNIIPANGGLGSFAPSRASAEAAKVSYSDEDIAKLKKIHSGLLEARDRLKDVA